MKNCDVQKSDGGAVGFERYVRRVLTRYGEPYLIVHRHHDTKYPFMGARMKWLAFLYVVSSLLAGCGSSLEGRHWRLTAYGPVHQPTPALADTPITAQFTNGNVGGSAGCNGYGGSYAVAGNTMTIGSSVFESTVMDCSKLAGVMEQEGTYISAVRATTAYTLEGNRLMLEYPGGVLQFEAQSTNTRIEE